jgi:hypothetical protein
MTLLGKGGAPDTTVHERRCNNCHLWDEVTTGQPGWQTVLERWEPQEPESE